jgi:hypothetical protein
MQAAPRGERIRTAPRAATTAVVPTHGGSRWSRAWGVVMVASVALVALAPRVTMASDAAPVVVVYRGPAECPNANSFRQRLQRRLPNTFLVELATPATRTTPDTIVVHVQVEATTDTFLAQLSLKDPSGQSSPRKLTGPKCGDLIEALAFTGALSVEQAQGQSSRQPSNGEAKSAAPAQPGPTSSQTPFDPAPTTGSKRPSRSSAALPQDVAPSVPTPAYHGRENRPDGPGFVEWSSQASAGLTLTSPLNTSVSPGVTVGVQFNAESATGWSPALGLSVQGSLSPLHVTNEEASFGMVSVQAYLCPGALHSRPWTMRLCGVFQVGSIHAQGENLDHTNSINTRSTAAGLVLTPNYFLSRHVFIGGQLGALATLAHHRFEIGTDRRLVARSRNVAPWFALEMGTTF